MKIGEKIKAARKALRMTQAELSRGIITRNMLCSIESGTANPSLDTLIKLSERLSLPASYFISEGDDLFFYKKAREIEKIRLALKSLNYKSAIERALSLGDVDDEISYILAYSYFKLAEDAVKNGSLESVLRYLDEFSKYKKNTAYNLTVEECLLSLYVAIAKNVKAPLLEFDKSEYEKVLDAVQYEYYKYLLLDYDYPYKTESYLNHLKAKQFIRERKYSDAIPLLLNITDNKNPDYDAYLIFGVYTDLETCYKKLYDFENAYRYSTKRLSLIESYKS